jgi:hypothetical protein
LENVTKTFSTPSGKITVLSDITFAVKRGRTLPAENIRSRHQIKVNYNSS